MYVVGVLGRYNTTVNIIYYNIVVIVVVVIELIASLNK